MKKILFTLILSSSFLIQSDNSRTIDKLTVDELTQIVRAILQESLEKCEVSGSMKGRAKVNLAVVGSVEAGVGNRVGNTLPGCLPTRL